MCGGSSGKLGLLKAKVEENKDAYVSGCSSSEFCILITLGAYFFEKT